MSQQDKYAQLFAAEAREHLAEMSRALIALEEVPEDRESLDSIFRSVHTIKGMAAMMGYAHVTELAHRTENLLDQVLNSLLVHNLFPSKRRVFHLVLTNKDHF